MTNQIEDEMIFSPQQARAIENFEEFGRLPFSCLYIENINYSKENVQSKLNDLSDFLDILRAQVVGSPKQPQLKITSNNTIKFSTIYEKSILTNNLASLKASLKEHYYQNSLYLSFSDNAIMFLMPSWSGDIRTLELLLANCLDEATNEEFEEAIQYTDLAHWLYETFEDEEASEQRSNWTKLLSNKQDLQTSTKLSDFSDRYFNIATKPFQSQHQTLELLACWALIMAKRLTVNEIIVGYYTDARHFEELQDIIGPIGKQIPIKVNLNQEITFSDLISQLKEQINKSEDRAEYFDWSLSEGNEAGFKVGYNSSALPENLTNKLYSNSNVINEIEYNNISLNVRSNSVSKKIEQLTITASHEFHSNNDCKFIAEQLEYLYLQVKNNSNIKLSQVNLNSPEHLLLIDRWSHASEKKLSFSTFVQAFEYYAEKCSSQQALHFESTKLTYGELNKKVNKLAHFLIEEGHPPGSRIGVCMNRTIEQVISILACMKAGFCYIPFDPNNPQSRLEKIILRAVPVAIITNLEHMEKVSDSPVELSLIDLQADSIEINECSDINPNVALSPKSSAYMIYTSGSTGEPKGVVISHAALENYIETIKQYLPLQEGMSMAALATIAADLGYTALFGALGNGLCLRLFNDELTHDANALADELAKEPVDFLKIVPSHLSALLNCQNPHHILPQQYLILGGDKSSPELIKQINRLSPQLNILNHYGPTETTIGISCNQFNSFLEKGNETSSLVEKTSTIGRPLENNSCYVLDDDFNKVGIGVQGALFIAGANLSDGYFLESKATANKFLPDPFSKHSGSRMYYSGDLAHYNCNGQLVFDGRKDAQVKLRGYRVEIAEIENELRLLADVKDVVVDIKQVNGNAKLVAYIMCSSPEVSTEIKDHIKEVLPDYMQPDYWLKVNSIPLTANGKVDKQGLPAPQIVLKKQTSPEFNNYKLSPIEAGLLKLYGQLLNHDDLSIEDNFFTLGGDSITAIQLVARAKQMGYSIKPKQVYDYPSVFELAKVVKLESLQSIASQELVLGQSNLTAIQSRFFKKIHIDNHQYNQSALYDLDASIDESILYESISSLLVHHDVLRLKFVKSNDKGWIQEFQGFSPSMMEHYFRKATIDQNETEKYDSELERIVLESQSNFDLQKGNLIQFVLITGSNSQPARLLIVAHHLLVDAVSWSILQEDLEVLYQQSKNGEPISLPSKTNSYKELVEILESSLQNGTFDQDVEYWNQTIRSIKPLSIVTQKENLVGDAENKVCVIRKELTDKINHQCNLTYNTKTTDLLLTALAMSFCHSSKTADISLMLEANARDISYLQHDSSRTMGWFTSMYPVNIAISNDFSITENIINIKETLRAVPESGFSFGPLAYMKNTLNCGQEFDEPQICFNYFGKMFNSENSNNKLQHSNKSAIAQIATRSTNQVRSFVLEIIGMETPEGLTFNFIYNKNLISEENLNEIIELFESNLEQVANACVSQKKQYTPSDFEGLECSISSLESTINSIDQTKYPIDDIYPATQVQTGILFHSLAMPDTGVYVPQHAIEINIDVDAEIFKKSWEVLIKRHPLFRTSFIKLDTEVPLQVVMKNADLDLRELDWSMEPVSNIDTQFGQLLKQLWLEPFDFEKAPLMRLCLIKLSHSKYRFIWTYHHVIIDGWSGPIILDEFFTIYDSIARGTTVNLPLRKNFIEYIKWLQKQNQSVATEYWHNYLSDYHHEQQLSDLYTPSLNSSNKADKYEVNSIISKHLSSSLQEFAQSNNVTLSVVFQAAWALLLFRYTQNKDTLFGLTVSGRPADLEGIESMVGQFINTLPIRISIEPEMPLIEFVQNVQSNYMDSNEYSFVPLSQIQKSCSSKHKAGLFDTLVVFENYPISSKQAPKMSDDVCSLIHSVSQNNYPLSLVVLPGDEIDITLKYSANNFSSAQVQTFSEAFSYIIEQICNVTNFNSSTTINDIKLVNDDELMKLSKWSKGETKQYSENNFISSFEQQVQKSPNRNALISYGQSIQKLSYLELNQQSNRLANFLLEEALPNHSKIGIFLPRSTEQLIAIIGCLKAGYCYVPMDISQPSPRLNTIIEQAKLSAIITTTDQLDKVSDSSIELSFIDLQQDKELIDECSAENLALQLHPQLTAYTIYTSGSTGQPKGVDVSHQALANYLSAINERLQLNDKAVMATLASASADLGYTAIYGALHTGKTLRIISEDKALDSSALALELEEAPVDCLKIVPSHLSALLSVNNTSAILPRECLILGGESATLELINAVRALSPSLRIINHYGPTEATIGISTFEFKEEIANIKTIGQPLNNCSCYVLDSSLQPVGINVEGELYLAGDNLAQGYSKMPMNTAQSFIPNPFSSMSGQRMYRTGDKAKFNSNGKLVFCGRKDLQVKIRGYRVELGEIEQCLLSFPEMNQVVVQVHEISQRNQLVAYLVGNSANEQNIRNHIRELLPDYMQPSLYMWLNKFPVTINGKLDIKKLPNPTYRKRNGQLPKTELQKQIAKIWSAQLQVDPITINDNFFDIGGDSLTLMQVHRRISVEIDPSVLITDLFKFATIEKLSDFIQTNEQKNDKSDSRHDRAALKKQAMAASKNRSKQRTKRNRREKNKV